MNTTPIAYVCDCTEADGSPSPRRAYVVTNHEGKRELVEYCADCAFLARGDWNGETAKIEPATFERTRAALAQLDAYAPELERCKGDADVAAYLAAETQFVNAVADAFAEDTAAYNDADTARAVVRTAVGLAWLRSTVAEGP